jgi:hypothetical protein
MRTSRRQLLPWAGAATVASFVPGCGRGDPAPGGAPPPPSSAFFSEAERSTLTALSEVVIPAGLTTPGGAELGSVAYIERLCTAFEGTTTPFIFAGGPFSGRRPLPTASGEPGTTSPSNERLPKAGSSTTRRSSRPWSAFASPPRRLCGPRRRLPRSAHPARDRGDVLGPRIRRQRGSQRMEARALRG